MLTAILVPRRVILPVILLVFYIRMSSELLVIGWFVLHFYKPPNHIAVLLLPIRPDSAFVVHLLAIAGIAKHFRLLLVFEVASPTENDLVLRAVEFGHHCFDIYLPTRPAIYISGNAFNTWHLVVVCLRCGHQPEQCYDSH